MFVLVIGLGFAIPVRATCQDRLPNVLRIGVYQNLPKIGISATGEPFGFHIDLLTELLKGTGIEPEYVAGTWEECLDRLRKGEIDVLPDVAYSAERARIFDFNNESVLTNWAVVYAAKSGSIDSIADLDRKRVAVLRNSIHTVGEDGIIKMAESYGISCDFLNFESYEETFLAVEEGRADAAVVNRLFGLMNESIFDIDRTAITFNPSQIRYAFSRSAPGRGPLIELFDVRLAILKENKDSAYHRAFAKYLLPQIAKERKTPEWLGSAILLAIALTLILSLFMLSARSGKKGQEQIRRFFGEFKSMGDIRSAIAEQTLISYAVFSIPLLLSVLYSLLSVQWSNLIWLYLPALLLPAIAVAFRKRLSVSATMSVTLLSMFTIGILTLVFWHNNDTGFMYFLTAGLLVSLVYGKRSGLGTITIGLIITVAAEILTQKGVITIRQDVISNFLSPSSWLFSILSFFMMFFTSISGIEKFYGQLIDAVENLEQRIAERTEYIDTINKDLQHEVEEHRKTEKMLEAARFEAEQANRSKSTFLAGMSHEIRTPLNVILGYSQLLSKGKGLSEESRREIETIASSGEHLLGLINEVLEMSKIEAGKVEVHEEICSVPEILGQVVAMFKGSATEKGIYFESHITEHVPEYICTDGSKLKQILINLIGNALKFTESGSITIDVTIPSDTASGNDDPDRIDFTVTDTGPGIEPGNLQRIFQPFEQTDEGRLKGGTGLGLSISRQYCSLLGGELSAKSEIGKGSRFMVSIRARACPEGGGHTPDDEAPVIGIASGKPPRILVVDDKEANRDILFRILAPLGFPIATASNGKEAVGMIDSWSPDLLLLDLVMPGLSGIDVLRMLRTDPAKNRIKMIIVTASAMESDRDEVLSLGADAFIRKPFRQSDIFNAIGDLFGLAYFRETKKPDAAMGDPISASELAAKMSSLPGYLIAGLREALLMGDLDTVKSLSAEIAASDQALADAIRTMADDFMVKALLELVRAAE